jgi:hypothetical protein
MATMNTALWTTERQTEMYRFFSVAFNAAPGTTYMDQLYDAVISGMSTKEIVNVFVTKSEFTSVYPRSMTNANFASKIVDNVVGSSASATAKAAAVADITAALTAGMSRGEARNRRRLGGYVQANGQSGGSGALLHRDAQ